MHSQTRKNVPYEWIMRALLIFNYGISIGFVQTLVMKRKHDPKHINSSVWTTPTIQLVYGYRKAFLFSVLLILSFSSLFLWKTFFFCFWLILWDHGKHPIYNSKYESCGMTLQKVHNVSLSRYREEMLVYIFHFHYCDKRFESRTEMQLFLFILQFLNAKHRNIFHLLFLWKKKSVNLNNNHNNNSNNKNLENNQIVLTVFAFALICF